MHRSSSGVSNAGVMSELSDLARPSGNNAPLSTDVAVEMDRMDRILAAHAPPPPPPQKDAVDDDGVSPQRSPVTYSSNGESLDSAKSSPSTSSTENGGEQNETDVLGTNDDMKREEKLPESRDTVFRSHSLFPPTASPKPKHRENYNDVYPDDVMPHKASQESHLPSVTDEDEEPEDAQTNPQVPSAREVASTKLSSIDAFEASFDTAFPVAFTSPKEGKSESLVTSEIYNPFFSSPAKSKVNQPNQDAEKGDVEKGRKWGASLRERSPVVSVRKSQTSRGDDAPNDGMPKILFSGRQPPIEDVDDDHSTPDTKSPERDLKTFSGQPDQSISPMIVSRVSTSGAFSTPPQFQKISPENQGVVVEQPRRPEKTVTASARARYERALQPRTYTSRMKDPLLDQSMSVDTSAESAEVARNSPSTVLRRLQQRRQKVEQRFQTTPDAGTGVPSMRHSTRSLQHPPVPSVDSPFDEDVGVGRMNGGPGRNLTSQNGSMSYRTSQNDAENSYQWSGSLSSPASMKLSPDSMNAEFRALDAMASVSYQRGEEDAPGSDNSPSSAGSSARYSALKQRRSVKQPVSYAEPPLNTKVRRGDVFFPRTENEDNSTTPVVSPGSSDDSDRRARTRSGASPDEVLKDLAGSTTVRS